MKLTPDPAKADSLFLYYLFSGPEVSEKIKNQAIGSSVPGFNLGQLRSISFFLPPLEEQRAITDILGSLDDKIELNRRMNATLEESARALFKSWFVDFDPVRARMEDRQPDGIDAETAALFPDRLVESELGPIPAGWRVGTIGEDFNLTMGQSPPGETYNEDGDGLPFFQGNRDFGFRYPSKRVFCTQPSRIAQPGDTLVSVRAPVGEINMASEECCIGRGVAAVRHKSGARSYTYYAVNALEAHFANFEGEGTVFGSISGQDFRRIAFVIPPADIVNWFETTVYPFDQQVEVLEREMQTLAATRDALLPKLLSGEVQVGEMSGYVVEE